MDLQLGYTQKIIAQGIKYNLLRNQLAYVLATGYWETANTMRPVEEAFYLGAKADAYRKKLRYYPWYGRGFVQLTWEINYKKYGITNPDDALNPDIAAYILVDGMVNGKFTGKKLSDYITLSVSNFLAARKIINGVDKAKEIAEIAKQYDSDLKAFGYGVSPTGDSVETPQEPTQSVPDTVPSTPTSEPKKSVLELIISILLKLFTRS